MQAVLSGALFLALSAPTAAPQLTGAWVTTSAAVDTSSAEAIVKDLVKPGMTDEQKVLAIFNWYRRVVYPHAYLADDRRDLLRQINSYGCTLCGSHAANLGWLLRTAGFKTRPTFIRDGGHTFVEAFYDNGWHAVDPETDFAVWSRGDQPHLISMEELKADPTLLDNPEKEGRARPWLFKAMKFPWTTRKVMADYCDQHKLDKMGMQWSSSVIKGETIKDYFIEGVKTLKYGPENDPYGGRISDPNLMKLTLRPHERLVRVWGNEGKDRFILGQGFAGYPAHLLYGGGADESDEEVFPYVEPYRKDKYGLPGLEVDRCYRYSGNGRLIWSPDIAAGELTGASGVAVEGLVVDAKTGLLRPVEAGKLGTAVVTIKSSYALVWADIKGTWLRAGEGDVNRISLWGVPDSESTTKKALPAQWTPVWTNDQTGTSVGGAAYGKRINGQFEYRLRIELLAGTDVNRCGLQAITFDHTFVNNWLVLPFFRPGENTVRVRLDNPDLLKQVKLTVKYEWAEGADWKDEKTDLKTVDRSPFEYTITVAGPKFPRMKVLTLEAVPR
jgi:hypothetical protein